MESNQNNTAASVRDTQDSVGAEDAQSPVQDTQDLNRYRAAYARKRALLSAIPPERLAKVNVDVGMLLGFAMGVLGKLQLFYEVIFALPGIKRELVEDAEDALLALGHAQVLYRAASAPVASIPELYEKLLQTRTILLADASALATRGMIPGDKLRELRGPVSQSATAVDVMALVTILRDHWSTIQNKTAIQLSELEQAETLADRLILAVGDRATSDGEGTQAARMRQAAFTYFVSCYDEIQRGMVFVRWHERDVDEHAPSPYAMLPTKRRKPEAGADDAEPAPVTMPTSALNPNPAKPVAGAPVPSAPIGHPDSSPFV
jgi:hypothetical protein